MSSISSPRLVGLWLRAQDKPGALDAAVGLYELTTAQEALLEALPRGAREILEHERERLVYWRDGLREYVRASIADGAPARDRAPAANELIVLDYAIKQVGEDLEDLAALSAPVV